MKYIFGLLVLAANFYGWLNMYGVGSELVRTVLFRRTGVSVPAQIQEPETATVSVDSLNMRSGPSADDGIVRIIHRGDVMTILGNSADTKWVKGEFGSQTGYVHEDFITIKGGE
jgi:uncharacterized protein YraI